MSGGCDGETLYEDFVAAMKEKYPDWIDTALAEEETRKRKIAVWDNVVTQSSEKVFKFAF